MGSNKYEPGSKLNEDYIEFGEFVGTSYTNVVVPEYDLLLCKLTEEPIAELELINDFTIEKAMLGINKISFSVQKSIVTSDGISKPNPLFDLVEGNGLVLVDNSEYYILSKPTIQTNDNGILEKFIQGFSREYELTQRLLNDYDGVSRVIYDYSNTIDENGIEVGFLNYVENNTSWSVGYINKDILKKYRMLKFNSTNIYKAFEQVQKTFGCIFTFDTINKQINVFDPMQLGVNQGVYISDENYINQLTQEIEDENIVTRLYLYGNENISIQPQTITGKPYIEDYSYFRQPKFMSDGLINGLKQYDLALNENIGIFDGLVKDKKNADERRIKANVELVERNKKLRLLELDWDLTIAEGKETTELNKKIKEQKQFVSEQEKIIDDIGKEIIAINKKIEDLRNRVDLMKFIDEKQFKEFDYFVKEEKYYDSNYTKDNIEELMEEGKKVLNKISKPRLTFSIEVDDFMTMAQGRFVWNRFILGDIINLEHKEAGFDYEVRLIGYVHTPDEKRLELKFTNIDNVYDNAIYLEQLLAETVDVSNSIDFNKYKWDKGEDVANEFSDYINHSLDLSNQALAKEQGQKPILDERGLWLYKETPDGKISPEQVRAINNVIAITKDNWETVEVAITPNGVMAKQLIGDIILGTDLKIISDSGIVEILNNVIKIKDDKGRLRVALGNYDNGKYGLQIKDKDGNNTIMDEDGMLQVWQEGRTDNVDENSPLVLNIFVPKNTRHIYNAQLRVIRDKFRSYSKSTDSERIRLTSTESGGRIDTTTESGGYENISETSDWDGADVDTTHGIENVDWDNVWRSVYNGKSEQSGLIGYAYDYHVYHHEHSVRIPEHRHGMSFRIPSHRHDLIVRSHDHDIEMPSHSHDIDPIIYKSGSYPKFGVRINTVNVSWDLLGGQMASWDKEDLNITQYLEKGKWNTIEIFTDRIGRIDATVFIQCLLNFDGLKK